MAFFNPFSGNQQDYLPWMSNVEKGIRGGHTPGTDFFTSLNQPFGGVLQAAPLVSEIRNLQSEVGGPEQIAQRWWGNVSGGHPTQAGLGWADLAPDVQSQVRTMFPGSYNYNMETLQPLFSSPRESLPIQRKQVQRAVITPQQTQAMFGKFQDLIRDDASRFFGGNNVWLDPNTLDYSMGSRGGISPAEMPDPYYGQLQDLLQTTWATHEKNPQYVPRLGSPDFIAPDYTEVLESIALPQTAAAPPVDVVPGTTGTIGNQAATGERPENAQVFDFQAPDNPLLPQVQEGQQQILNMLMEGGQLPYVESIMKAQADQQARALDERKAALAARGVLNSTPGLDELDRLRTLQQGQQAQTAMQGLNAILPAYQNAYGNIFNQGVQGRQQSINEFLQFLDRQTQMDQWDKQYQNQSLALLLNALGTGAINPQMPAFNIPNPPPGLTESVGTLGANALMTPGFGDTPLGGWMGF
jgi:hypothetical protein